MPELICTQKEVGWIWNPKIQRFDSMIQVGSEVWIQPHDTQQPEESFSVPEGEELEEGE